MDCIQKWPQEIAIYRSSLATSLGLQGFGFAAVAEGVQAVEQAAGVHHTFDVVGLARARGEGEVTELACVCPHRDRERVVGLRVIDEEAATLQVTGAVTVDADGDCGVIGGVVDNDFRLAIVGFHGLVTSNRAPCAGS